MSDHNREAFELAAKAIGFNIDKTDGNYYLTTQRAWEMWQAAKAHLEMELMNRAESGERPGA